MPDGRRGRRRDPDDGRARRAGDRRRGRLRLRARGRARRATSRRPTASCASRGRPRSTSPGRSTRCTTIRRPSTRGALHADEVERCRRMAAHTAELLDAGDARAHALQRGRARDRRLRQRGRRAAHGVGAGPARARLGRRDAAAAAGRAADRLGARDRSDPARGDRRLRRRVADGARRGRLRDHRRRPDRRERRHRQQDRHLLARRARAPPRDPALRRRAERRPSISRPPTARAIPIEERDPAEVTTRFAARNPAFDVTPADADHGDRHRAGRAPRAVRELARRGGERTREGDRPRRRLRDAPASADRHVGEGAAAGRRPPILDLDRRRASQTVAEVDEVHVVTNAHKAPAFVEWAQGREVTVHDDGTSSNDDRLGAIGDMQFVIERAGIDDDLLVIAGDNLFEFSLVEFVALWRSKGTASAVAVRDVGSLELAQRYGIVELADDGRVARLRREAGGPAVDARRDRHVPLPPRACPARPHVSRRRAIRPTSPAGSSAGCTSASPSTAGRSTSGWYDIGDHEQLLEADNRFRRAQGLPDARGLQPRLAVTHSAQRRDRHVTRSPVASVAWLVDLLLPPRCVSCGGPARTLCSGCRARLRPLEAAALRPLRRADGVARRALPRVRRASARLRLRALGRRVRRAGAGARARLEGARAPPPRSLCRRARRRARRAAGRGRHHVCARRTRSASSAAAGTPPRRSPVSSRGRWELELVVGARARACSRAAGDASVRPARRERARRVRGPARARRAGAARRRRLHDGRDRERGRIRAAAARRSAVEVVTLARAIRR